MVLHLPHFEVGLGVIFNDITKDTDFYTTTSRFVASWFESFSQEPVTDTEHIPPYNCTRRETCSGCHGGTDVGTMTTTTGPEDYPWATTSPDVPGRKHQTKLRIVK
jgi:hypothetical protein